MTPMKLKLVMFSVLALGMLSAGGGLWVPEPAVGAVADTPAKPDEGKGTDLHGDPLPPGAILRIGTVRFRHGQPITFVGFGADDKTIVSASMDGTVRIWERDTGKEIRRIGTLNPRGEVMNDDPSVFIFGDRSVRRGAALSADGKIIAHLANDQAIHLWDAATGKELHQIKPGGPPTQVPTIGLSPDGKSLAVRAAVDHIQLYDVATAKPGRKLNWKPGGNNGAMVVMFRGQSSATSFSPNGRYVVTSASERENNKLVPTLLVWDLEAKEGTEPLRIKQTAANSAAIAFTFSADSKSLACAQGAKVVLFDPASGKETSSINVPQATADGIAFSPDGKLLATKPARGGEVILYDVASGKQDRKIGDPTSGLNRNPLRAAMYASSNSPDFAFSRDGKLIAIGSDNNLIALHEVETGKEVAQAASHRGPLAVLGVSPDGKTIITQAHDRTLRRWDAANGKELGRVRVPDTVTRVLLSPDGNNAAFMTAGKTVHIHDIVADKEVCAFDTHADGVAILAFSGDGKLLATRGRTDGSIKLFEAATGKEQRTITVPAEEKPNPNGAINLTSGSNVVGLAFSPDGRILATNGPKNSICTFDAATGKEGSRITLPQQTGSTTFAFAPDSRSLVTENPNKTYTVWEVWTGGVRGQFGEAAPAVVGGNTASIIFVNGNLVQGVGGAVPCVAISPDGRMLAGRSHDGAVQVWDIFKGKKLAHLLGHQGTLTGLAFAADGSRLVSGSQDTTALVWDTAALKKNVAIPVAKLTDKQVEAIWTDLTGSDSRKALQGIVALAGSPEQAVPFLARQLKPIEPPDAKRIDQLIADLDAKEFSARQKANDELEKFGELAVAALKKVLDGQPSLDTRQRVEKILAKATSQVPPADRLQSLRAMEALELIATAEARAALETMAKGAPGARVTEEAQATLKRMAR